MSERDAGNTGRIDTYPKPNMGERVRKKDLPLGWAADNVDVPDSWTVDFYEGGDLLRFRREVDREEYGLKPPGYPGVGIVSGWDYWQITGDTDRVIRDAWRRPEEGYEPQDVVDAVEEAIEAVSDDLERVRLSNWLDGCVPETVVENLIDRFRTAEKVAKIEEDTPLLESVDGIGLNRRRAIQERFAVLWMSGDWSVDTGGGSSE